LRQRRRLLIVDPDLHQAPFTSLDRFSSPLSTGCRTLPITVAEISVLCAAQRIYKKKEKREKIIYPSMSLLTPSESHAIQSFLTSIDHNDSDSPLHSNLAWPMYSALNLEDIPSTHDVPIPHGREALTKATKDLMSLDGDKWKTGLAAGAQATSLGAPQYQLHQPFQFTTQLRVDQAGFSKTGSQNHHYQQQQSLLPSNDIFTNFAFFKTAPNLQPTPSSSLARPPTLSIAPHRTLIPSSSSTSVSPPVSASTSSASSSSTLPTPTSYASASVSSARQQSPTNGKYKRVNLTGNDRPSHKRRRPSTSHNATLSLEATSTPNSQYANEPLRHPHTHLRDGGFLATAPELSAGSAPLPCPDSPKSEGVRQTLRTTKATLLSASQKKANHIQSEQKRRANIRRGYEALCETVPALREALREEEASSTNGEGCMDKGKGKLKRGRVKVKMDGEKMDGRAGPRSENVVLSKSPLSSLCISNFFFVDALFFLQPLTISPSFWLKKKNCSIA
jgi:hypothetical protein